MLRFRKLQATGNDFISLEIDPGALTEAQRRQLCHRHWGIGADGILFVKPVSLRPEQKMGVFEMNYWNADGRRGTFCGNGARAALWLAHHYWGVKSAVLLAADGAHEAYVLSESPFIASVQLTLHQSPISLPDGRWFVHTGSPHLLIETSSEALFKVPLSEVAPPLRWEKTFDPGGVNVSFFSRTGQGTWQIRTYERGVEAETLSCGTACVALAAVADASEVEIHTRGGILKVLRKGRDTFWLIGPAAPTIEGFYQGVFE